MTGSAREAILESIRANLAASAPYDGAVHIGPARATHSHGRSLPIAVEVRGEKPDIAISRVQRFVEQATGVGASCEIVAGEEEAFAAISRALERAGARSVVGSDAPIVHRAMSGLLEPFVAHAIDGFSRDELFACDAGISTAQLGIAETGTLVLQSARERHRLLSLVPPVHIALLSADDICNSLLDVITLLHRTQTSTDVVSHAITFITGPSRTSDIELTLTIGVHGPRTLHIIILENHA
jgi:L-lactate dehydrogenase complex protein LldG